MSLIKNIKVSVKIDKLDYFGLKDSLKHIQCHNNFYVLKDRYTYVLFKPKIGKTISHLNITKIVGFDYIIPAIQLAKTIFKGEILYNTVKIDNITATHYLNETINLSELYEKYNDTFNLHYNNDVFPGLSWKSGKGTAIIFHSGNVNIVGVKSVQEIVKIIDQLWTWKVEMKKIPANII